jgi:hypothetical protein
MSNYELISQCLNIAEPPKKLNSPTAICKMHEGQGLQFKCLMDGQYGCILCMTDHADHSKDNTKIMSED